METLRHRPGLTGRWRPVLAGAGALVVAAALLSHGGRAWAQTGASAGDGGAGAAASTAREDDAPASGHVQMSQMSGPPDAPRRHFRLMDPARLSLARAEDIYRILSKAMRAGYGRSALDTARDYLDWRRYNGAPYLSSTHGNHYVNNYANGRARAYGKFETAGVLPLGSIIAKDSFSVTETGGLLIGPLFIMEKMPSGFNYVSGDWRYSVVQPDGTVLGETLGAGSKRVEYCIACHLAVEQQDHLYFVPKDRRVELLE